MNRYKAIHRYSRATGVAVGLGVANIVPKSLGVNDAGSFSIWGLAIVLLGSSSYVFNLLFDFAFERSTRMRRVLLGHQYVEGCWLNVVRDSKGTIVNYGQKSFQALGDSLLYSGENYDPQTDLSQGFYSSDFLMVAWPRIRYKYSYSRPDNGEVYKEGYGELQFVVRDGPPLKHNGFFIDLVSGDRYSLEGWKVTEPATLQLLDQGGVDSASKEMRKALGLLSELEGTLQDGGASGRD